MPPKPEPAKKGGTDRGEDDDSDTSPHGSNLRDNEDDESEDGGPSKAIAEGTSDSALLTRQSCADINTGAVERPAKKLKLTISTTTTNVLTEAPGVKSVLKRTAPKDGNNDYGYCQNPKCGQALGSRTNKGPAGEKICPRCYSRLNDARNLAKNKGLSVDFDAPDATWRESTTTKKPRGTTPEDGNDDGNCQNPRCGKARTTTIQGPAGELLCGQCYWRFADAWKAAKAKGVSVDFNAHDAFWRESTKGKLRGPRKRAGGRERKGDKIGKETDNNDELGKATDGDLTDDTCQNLGSRRCDHCGFMNAGNIDLCDLCQQRRDAGAPPRPNASTIIDEPLRQHTELIRLAATHWRLRHQNVDLLNTDQPPLPTFSTDNYWNMDGTRLTDLAKTRGLYTRFPRINNPIPRHALINNLQINDAYRGVLPRPVPQSASKHHTKAQDVLEEDARKRGYFKGKGRKGEKGPQTDKWTLIAWLEQTDVRSDIFTPADETQIEIARILVADLNASLHGVDVNQLPIETHVTHNRGIYGSEDALNQLQDAIETNHMLPDATSGARLLCGPNALEMTLDEVRRIMRSRHPDRDDYDASERHISAHDMMEVLFTNYDRTRIAGPDEIGEPTAEYQAYLDEITAHIDDHAERQDAQSHMRSLNNLHVEQLQAIITMLRLHERLIDDFGFGVVIGKLRPSRSLPTTYTSVLHPRPSLNLHNLQHYR
jgi:uncharacterized low-complexity protein